MLKNLSSFLKLLFIFAIISLFIVLAIYNQDAAQISTPFAPYKFEAKLFFIMIFFFLFGFVISMIIYSKNFLNGKIIKKRRRRKKGKQKNS